VHFWVCNPIFQIKVCFSNWITMANICYRFFLLNQMPPNLFSKNFLEKNQTKKFPIFYSIYIKALSLNPVWKTLPIIYFTIKGKLEFPEGEKAIAIIVSFQGKTQFLSWINLLKEKEAQYVIIYLSHGHTGWFCILKKYLITQFWRESAQGFNF